MKRSWIGLIFLLVLLAAAIGTTIFMDKIHQPVASDLRQAAQCAQSGDWVNADGFSQRAWEHWDKWNHFRACFADHTPMEEIDAAMEELKVYLSAREEVAFAASCQELARKVEAMGEAHGLLWWNLL